MLGPCTPWTRPGIAPFEVPCARRFACPGTFRPERTIASRLTPLLTTRIPISRRTRPERTITHRTLPKRTVASGACTE